MKLVDVLPSSKITGWMIHGTGLALLVIAAGVVEILVIAPMRGQSNVDRVRITELEKQLAAGGKIRDEYEQARKGLDEKKATQRAFRERLPSEPLEAEFLSQVAKLAQNVNLQVRDYRPGKVTSRGDYSEVVIELSGDATYESVCRFLDELRQIPRLNSLTGIEIEAAPEKPLYPIRLNFSAYFVPMNTEGES